MNQTPTALRAGIDVSKERLEVFVLPEGEAFPVANDQEGIYSLLELTRSVIFGYLEGFYNRCRLPSALSYRSPADYEEATMEGAVVA